VKEDFRKGCPETFERMKKISKRIEEKRRSENYF